MTALMIQGTCSDAGKSTVVAASMRAGTMRITLLFSLLALGARAAQSQSPPPICREFPPPALMAEVAVSLGVKIYKGVNDLQDKYDSKERAALLEIATAIRAGLQEPPPLPSIDSSMRFAMFDSASSMHIPEFASPVAFTLHADGHIDSVVVQLPSVDPRADSTLVDAVRRASGSGLADAKRRLGGKTLRLAAFADFDRSDLTRPSTHARVPFYQRLFPAYPGTLVSMLPPERGPTYPDPDFTGDVLLDFIVTREGIAEPGSVRVVRSTSRMFERRVLEWLPLARFRPATVGGCVVRALVRQPFAFRKSR